MATNLVDRAWMSVSGTPGTGNITLGSVVAGNQSFSDAGVTDGVPFSYVAIDGNDFEIGTGQAASSVTVWQRTTVSRSVVGGTAGTSKLNLSSAAQIFLTARAVDLAVSGTPDGSKYVRDDKSLAYPHKGVAPVPTDWNNVQTPGVWTATGLSNAPDGINGWFYVEVLQHVGYVPATQVYLTQTATGLTFQGKWCRTCVNGSWGAWRRLDRDDASVAKAWAVYGTTGGVATVGDSYGVSSITRLGNGSAQVNFSTAFASVNYAVVVSIASSGQSFGNYSSGAGTKTASSVVCQSSSTTALADVISVSMAAFGDQ